MKIKKTSRGFGRIEFIDYYGIKCSLQKSSLADKDAIWLGCNDADPKQLIPGQGWTPIKMPDKNEWMAHTRMHLTQKEVKKLLPHLIKFVKTGEI